MKKKYKNKSPPEEEQGESFVPSQDHQPQPEQNKQKFSQAFHESSQILIRMKTVFPYDLFPDILTVDPLKVNYTHKIFFASSFTESIPIADITNVVIEESIMFATLRISFISYPTRQIYIKPLWKRDAEKAREIIAGLMVTNREKIEMEKVRVRDPNVIAQLGHMNE